MRLPDKTLAEMFHCRKGNELSARKRSTTRMKFVRQSVHLQMIYPQAGGVAEIGFEHDVGNRAIHCDEVGDNHEFRESCDRHGMTQSLPQTAMTKSSRPDRALGLKQDSRGPANGG